MQPIGPLMHEHRLIERLIVLMEAEAGRIEAGASPDSRLIDEAVDFFRYYADRCHHGKEEEILFAALAQKPLSDEERRILGELVAEHVRGRALVLAIHDANGRAVPGDPSRGAPLVRLMRELSGFYRTHIEKEDKRFFHPVMRHFAKDEMEAMLLAFDAVETRVFREKYAAVAESREGAASR
ncbi:MAG: hemerythrin domain-containing protein [Desulfovibrionaceae bacterium]|nr:hemerythrin domain-containing protein [Desulfovibrionaceae bacterium]